MVLPVVDLVALQDFELDPFVDLILGEFLKSFGGGYDLLALFGDEMGEISVSGCKYFFINR